MTENKANDKSLERRLVHEANNVLAVVIGRTYLLLNNPALSGMPPELYEKLRCGLTTIESSAQRLTEILATLGSFYRGVEVGVEFEEALKLGSDETTYRIAHVDDEDNTRIEFLNALTVYSNLIPSSAGVFGHRGKRVKYDVKSFGSVDEALREIPSLGTINLLVTDREMPELDGYHLLDTLNQSSNKRVRKPEYGNIKSIAMLTAGITQQEAERTIETYGIPILSKPFKPLVLEKQIYKAINPSQS
ncbi:response regulator [Candidatus Woesearchaeota archaeon]|nr:response regulator [Candidatus Woesearchaeota archaeon]